MNAPKVLKLQKGIEAYILSNIAEVRRGNNLLCYYDLQTEEITGARKDLPIQIIEKLRRAI